MKWSYWWDIESDENEENIDDLKNIASVQIFVFYLLQVTIMH